MTPQERAAALLERMGLCGHPADSQFVGDIIEHDAETRRAALLEAAQVARNYIKARDDARYMSGDDDCVRWRKSYRIYADAADALDRLAQEG